MPNWTLRDLYLSSTRLSPTRKNPPESPSRRLEKVIPFAGVKTVLFQLAMRGVTQNQVTHRVNILFTGIDVKTEPTNGHLEIKDNTGTYYFAKPTANGSIARVRCTCHDFYFTCGIWDFNTGALFGDKPRPYKRKTPPPPKGWPYRNPDKIPGTCKHIFNAIKFLQSSGYVI